MKRFWVVPLAAAAVAAAWWGSWTLVGPSGSVPVSGPSGFEVSRWWDVPTAALWAAVVVAAYAAMWRGPFWETDSYIGFRAGMVYAIPGSLLFAACLSLGDPDLGAVVGVGVGVVVALLWTLRESLLWDFSSGLTFGWALFVGYSLTFFLAPGLFVWGLAPALAAAVVVILLFTVAVILLSGAGLILLDALSLLWGWLSGE